MSFLADTTVLSELIRPQPNPGVKAWAEAQPRLHISVITVAELRYGLAWKPRPRIEQWLSGFLSDACVVLPVDEPTAAAAGQLRGQLQAQGKLRSMMAMLIAGTALVHGLVLVTRNTGDFQDCGLALLDPFSG